MTNHQIWLYTPAGEIKEIGHVLVVVPTMIRVVGELTVSPAFPPGKLMVTERAFEHLEASGITVGQLLNEHCRTPLIQHEVEGDIVYNRQTIRHRDLLIITYIDDHTAVILSEEY